MGREENAIIKSTQLGREDHGIFSCMILLDFGGSGQGFGGYDLRPDGEAVKWIDGILRVLDVTKWENLAGTHCRVRRENTRGPIISIGHFIEDKWFTSEP